MPAVQVRAILRRRVSERGLDCWWAQGNVWNRCKIETLNGPGNNHLAIA